MEKIDGADPRIGIAGAAFSRPLKPKAESKRETKAGKGVFRSALEKAEDERELESILGPESGAQEAAGRMDVGSLLEGVTEAGEELKREPTLARIKSYKDAVRRFMSKVVRDSFAAEETTGGIGFKKRKKYTIVRVVDEKLESLAAEILHHQRDQLEILRRLDEIRGLLVDLMQ